MQSRPEVVPLRQGDAVIFAVNRRPVQVNAGFTGLICVMVLAICARVIAILWGSFFMMRPDNFGGCVGNWVDDLNGRGARYKPLLAAAEKRYGIPSGMLARLAWQESRFRDDIVFGRTVSSAGAMGIMQIVTRWHPGVDPLNPAQAIDYAGQFLARLYKKFGTWELALKAYNWGEGNLAKWLRGEKIEPLETRLYSAQILSDLRMDDMISRTGIS